LSPPIRVQSRPNNESQYLILTGIGA